ncbi:hypothetical protein THAOC_08043 [Thalassiosira oceanica]|uniref:Uncharacterized protein n=1 Tax=Thalassiosira oceanica TaxID=159749 RepID=K0SYV0_THAOC|nr:hypothetical protein THAOC_08043 [Thalassiosira oceanica]|eukprot:EJK70585.1 hypothetical protein THAOC_08043 [Thalassiosira oceanica]
MANWLPLENSLPHFFKTKIFINRKQVTVILGVTSWTIWDPGVSLALAYTANKDVGGRAARHTRPLTYRYQRKVLLSRVVIIRFLVVVVVVVVVVIGDRVVSSLNQLDRIFFLASI